ncbi:MAG: hypothetical protein IJ193_02170 [Bacilli bacterium]|nr:hypothetical protein [Bacilli bacterium]
MSKKKYKSMTENRLKNDFYYALEDYEWFIYYTEKMNYIIAYAFDDFDRVDIISDKIIQTHYDFKNDKEEIINVFKRSKKSQYLDEFVIREANNYGYSNSEIQRFIENMYGKENISRYNTTNNSFERYEESGTNCGKTIKNNR